MNDKIRNLRMQVSTSHEENDVKKLDMHDMQKFIDRVLKVPDEDNETFLRKLRSRIDEAGIRLPTVEVRFKNLSVEADCFIGDRALPTLPNAARNIAETALSFFGIKLAERAKFTILKDVSGIIKPSRMTLLLGPPLCGKTTLLLALAGRLNTNLKASGEITYNGHKLDEFVPQKTSAYVSQNDVHVAELTVGETLDFSARCQGVGNRYELLKEVTRREKESGINPNAEVDLFMKATALEGVESSPTTEYILKILGLNECRDIIVGDQMKRGISGGQKKRVTTGEMIVGPSKTLFMDEISTGLDSSTTFQVVKCLQQIAHLTEATILMSLLQPDPEMFNLFDDIILLSEGQTVYHGPREHALEFFGNNGFNCPDRKGIADFLQEVTSKKDQEQYWADRTKPYRYVPVDEFAERFKLFHVGMQIRDELTVPYDKNQSHKSALTVQIIVVAIIASTVFLRTKLHTRDEEDGAVYIGALVFGMIINTFNGYVEISLTIQRLPVFYKHSDLLFYPTWAFAIPNFLLRIPISLFESVIWMVTMYYTIGFAPEASRFFKQLLWVFLIQQMAVGLFRLIAGVMKEKGASNEKLQLLHELTGTFRPGVLTALMGVSGAGKTTLMDVLSGRKTRGYIEGDIRITGFPKKQQTFARISGYCEQNDIHSPQVTVHESLMYSAFLRLPKEVSKEEIMARTYHLKDAIVGIPGVTGLSTEQRKRLTIAVELVANPSIIFMDEPTSGLDARSAAIVMRTVRNTVDTGRTVVCTIHQPGIDIFEAFDEAIPRVLKIEEQRNPAAWILEVSSVASELQLGIDFGEYYKSTPLYQKNSTDLMTIIGAMYASVLFVGINNCATVQPVVAVERTVFYRERAAGMYSVIAEVPYIFVQTTYYTLIVYAMVSFEWKAAKFFWFFFVTFFSFLYFTYYGMMTVSMTPNLQVAAICSNAFYYLFNLFSGFFIPGPKIPKWWIWYYWICPMAWTVYGLIVSQYGDIEDEIKVPGLSIKPSVKTYIEQHFGYNLDFMGAVAAVLVGFTLFFAFMYAYCIKTINFQER
ncbi:hypothetical protein DH2020_016341 [Rehmannia glutinosa]|uniref:ABC transporter domain-containing protein n=1 Tax=Rehmannia glutinosa TaxID=99300 RepID=A0ABR0WQC3_REHGL